MNERRNGSSRIWWRVGWRATGRRATDVPAAFAHVFGQSTLGAYLRNFWLLVITGLVLLALHGQSVQLSQQVKSRHFVIAVSCAVQSGTSEAGRAIISGSARAKETPFDRALERLGYPPRPQRIKAADVAGSLYVAGLARRVRLLAGSRAKGLIMPDGGIDCHRLRQIADEIAQR